MLHSARITGCLTCGNDDGRFESVEHIIPAALGNIESSGLVERELTIPKGETCTKCNGQPLSRADLALVEWPPISVFRSLGLIRKRRGGLADAVVGTAWRLDLDESDRRKLLAARRRRHEFGITPRRRSPGALQDRAGDTLAAGPCGRSKRSLGPDRERREWRCTSQRPRDGPRPARIAL